MNAHLGFDATVERDFAGRLGRLRWRRAIPVPAREVSPQGGAREELAGCDLWIFVREPSALPLVARSLRPNPPAGRVLAAATSIELDPASPHTLSELEAASVRLAAGARDEPRAPALAFRVSDFPPGDESAGEYVERLARTAPRAEPDGGFLALSLPDTSEEDRQDLTRFFDPAPLSLLDVGCGSGGASAAVKARHPRTRATGIERRPDAAARARARLDRVLESDAPAALEELVRAHERFDAFLFADVLEHLADPQRALALAGELASTGARLVASVPQIGHVSVVRDLVAGRFDPVPAGLCDAGHLRWFTRGSLVETLEEAGWRVEQVASLLGAPAAGAAEFVARLPDWEDLDRDGLATYQWLAVASRP